MWHDTAAIVVEIVSPDDETYAKFDFYAAHRVEEIIVADPTQKTVRCFHRTVSAFGEEPGSTLVGVGVAELTASIRWP